MKEKSELLIEGFPDWTRSDYKLFISALEKYGKHDLSSVVEEMVGHGQPQGQGQEAAVAVATATGKKSAAEVERYYSVFWKRYRELSDWQKAIDRIERGQKRIDRLKSLQLSVDKKIRRHYGDSDTLSPSHPLHPANELNRTIGSGTSSGALGALSTFSCSCVPALERRLLVPWSLSYGNPGKGRYFVEEEDHALVLLMHRYGYGSWNEITQTLQRSLAFSFNFCLSSRSVSDVVKRCEFLLRLIEKENQLFDGGAGTGTGEGGEGEEESKETLGTAAGVAMAATPLKGKRGRKRKEMDPPTPAANGEEQQQPQEESGEKVPKKRGRKPGRRSLPKEDV
jgi:SWI/SNF-related matrix-associated actin-dependent regulator of chromatin subfamily A member 5